ncbi:MAG: hypothetical protein OEZ06_16065 [Myxococcales bacterium]|nr:hypothetical protein [Myxococcales bacterium]
MGAIRVLVAIALGVSMACTGATGPDGDRGATGEPGARGAEGPDGPEGPQGEEGPEGSRGPQGESGPEGSEGPAGPAGEAGPTGQSGPAGPRGEPGSASLLPGQSPGLSVKASASAPANGSHYVSGERIALVYVLEDAAGNPLALSDFSQTRLMLSGPRDVLKTRAAVELLNTSADRSDSSHHYISLKDTTNANLAVAGNVVTYTLEAVGDEEPGTYTAGLWLVSALYAQDQDFALLDLQIGTATVEPEIAAGCDACHEGAANGQLYLHHVDPGFSPYGNPSLDTQPPRACRTCHNQDGYAAVRKCDDGSNPVRDAAGDYICEDGSQNWSYMSDPIIRRVHGVHNGTGLSLPYNVDPERGDFRHYTNVTFPADVRNCQSCHTDDAWKTKPSRQACGSCHDHVDWPSGAFTPPHSLGEPTAGACSVDGDCNADFGEGSCNTGSGECEITTHAGGAQSSDADCATCHGADSGISPITTAHAIAPRTSPWELELTIAPPPANGSHYVAGEAPVVFLVIKDPDTGVAIDHTTVASWNRAYLYLNGPRAERIPALTTAARAEVVTAAGPFDLSAATALSLKVGALAIELDPADATFANAAAASAAEVIAWLNSEPNFLAAAYAEPRAGSVVIHALPSTSQQALEVLTSDVATALGLSPGRYIAQASSGSYASNDLKADPKVTLTSGSVQYQLDDVGTAVPGTYSVWVRARQVSGSYAVALANLQVGSAVEEPKVATNCYDCHSDGFHGGYAFDADVCGSCHDYRRAADPRLEGDPLDGWGASAAPGRSNAGFGAGPLSRRIHGVHFGNYVNFPYDIHASWGEHFSHIVFPQDVRNCVKCHSDSDSWRQQPGRLACFSCHDSDAAWGHGQQMTYDPTPVDPFSGDEQESCTVCHGQGRDYAVDAMHDITDPYAPPYPREGWVIGPHGHAAGSE